MSYSSSSSISSRSTSSLARRSKYVWDDIEEEVDEEEIILPPPTYSSSSSSRDGNSKTSSPSRSSTIKINDISNHYANGIDTTTYFSISASQLRSNSPTRSYSGGIRHPSSSTSSNVSTITSAPTSLLSMHSHSSNNAKSINNNNYGSTNYNSSSSRNANDSSSVASSSLQEVVEQVKVKVDAMKAELHIKSQKAAELEAELGRLHTAKVRRIDKFKKIWSNRLRDNEADQKATVQKQVEFINRLEADVKTLQEKKETLQLKSSKMQANREQSLEILHEEMKRKLNRAKKQWEMDEKIAFEKIASGRAEGMKKQAADAFGPRIDKLVVQGKEEVRKRADEIESNLLQLKHTLQAELENKLVEAAERLREELRNDDERTRRSGEKRLEDCIRKHADEVTALRDRFSRERKLAEETAERTRRLDAETSLETMRGLRKVEAQQMQDLIANQQRDIATMMETHAEETAGLQKQLREEEERWVERCRSWQEQMKGERGQRAKAKAMMKAATETEKVLTRLRDEVAEERRKSRASIDSGLEDLRVQVQTRLDSMHHTEQRSVERAASLRAEVEGLRKQLSLMQENLAPRSQALSSAKAQLSDLRLELRQVEHELESAEQQREEESGRRRQKVGSELDQWIEKDREASEALSRQEVEIANKKEDVRFEQMSELSRIKDKISSLLSKKEGTIRELRRQLAELQEKSAQVQEAIDCRRDSKFGITK